MISLFSTFDIYFFLLGWIGFTPILIRIYTQFRVMTLYGDIFSARLSNLASFFSSLKRKSFNKSSHLIFLTWILVLFRVNFFSVFSFIFPLSSQVRVILFLSLTTWVTSILFSLINLPSKFLSHLIPEGTPLPLTFLLFLIELVRNLIRPLTLIVRLVANILAGHLLIILLSRLVFIFTPAFPFYIMLNLVEIFVSLIQTYIFVTLSVLYFREV